MCAYRLKGDLCPVSQKKKEDKRRHFGRRVICLFHVSPSLVVTGNNITQVQKSNNKLYLTFDARDLGDLSISLEWISLASLIIFIFHKLDMTICFSNLIWLLGSHLLLHFRPSTCSTFYSWWVGSLMQPLIVVWLVTLNTLHWLKQTSHLLLIMSTSLCKHHSPLIFKLSNIIFQYIKDTLQHGLTFHRPKIFLSNHTRLQIWQVIGDWWSTPCASIFLGTKLLSRCAKLQPTGSRSSVKAEYCTLATTPVELVWFRYPFGALGIPIKSPPHLPCDNISAISLVSNPIFHALDYSTCSYGLCIWLWIIN